MKKVIIVIACVFVSILGSSRAGWAQTKRILFVVTNHDKMGETEKPTGYSMTEVAGCWNELYNAGYEIDFVSPLGGKAPVDNFGLNLSEKANSAFWNNPKERYKIEHTFKPSEVNSSNYDAIYFVGGHGAMWDFVQNDELAKITTEIYEKSGIVSAVCHGVAGLLNIKLSNGHFLIQDKKINGFTNEEELAIHLEKAVPFMLETKLIERGGIFEKSGLWQSHVAIDQRLITGQNPASAKYVGLAILEQLKK